MTDLYTYRGLIPAPLPARYVDDDGKIWTDLVGQLAAEHLSHQQISSWGFRKAGPRPDDTDTQTAEWDPEAEAWVMVDRPPPPPEPEPILAPISKRQYFQALASDPYAIITQQEALDAVKSGEIPLVMQAVIDGLPGEAQFAASMVVAGGTEFLRDDPLVAIFGASQAMDEAEIDEFWRFAGTL